jgi:CRISPR-associated protein Csh2
MSDVIQKNGEILFLYDAKMCNPNGDPDDENRPRMDTETERCLVSDVRLKRYIRDYLEEKGYDIYVTKLQGVVEATERLKRLLAKDNPSGSDLPALLKKLVDIRLFGATMPIKGEKRGEGEAVNLTGPVQFTWGYSLNKVQHVDSVTITSQFATREDARQGTFGKDYRLYYALLAFHGVVSAKRAAAMKIKAAGDADAAISKRDLDVLDEAVIKAIPLLATRSKIGQYPRLYMRFVFADDETFMGDLRDYVKLVPDRNLRSTADSVLEVGNLLKKISQMSARIEHLFLWHQPELQTAVNGSKVDLREQVEQILSKDKVKLIEGI